MTTQEVVAAGLEAILERAPEALSVTTVTPQDAADDAEADIVLYDVILLTDLDRDGRQLDRLLRHGPSTVIAVDRTLRPELGARAKEQGVEYAVTLGITGHELVDVIRAASVGHLEHVAAAHSWDTGDHVGADVGLSGRESQVLGLVAQARSNQEIAEALFISINSVKTYIRSAYRKIGVSGRAQAVAWGIQHGFDLGPSRPGSPGDASGRHPV